MRHKIAYRKLNRTSEHRKALFKNMLNSLIKYEQITTTLPKAKELKPKIDKVITLGKKSDLQSKKSLFTKLQNKDSVKKLTNTLSQRSQYGHEIAGSPSKPEGFVAIRGGRPSNFVDRKEFSAANFNKG